MRLELDLTPLPGEAPRAGLGDSLALNGVCLTVAELLPQGFAAFDVIPESLERTNLGELQPGSKVHVERALRLGDRLDGHMVQGHVEGTGRLAARRQDQGQLWLEVEAAPEFLARCLPKGSVTLDGVSLTIAELSDAHLAVALVPHTLEVTLLGERAIGDRLNLEADLIGQWVQRLMESRGA
ncbi:MAG: riboflavin synthase [Planctomycetota bacterium]|nr:MAG: riboflavin synthase [Planctomycetota bacterium]